MQTKAAAQSDQELARQASNGDHSAFEAIVARYSRPLAEFAAAKTNTVQDAEDIVQETFLRAFTNLDTFDTRYSLKNWLFTIAWRLIISGYRKKQPRPLDLAVLAAMPGADPVPAPAPQGDWLWELAKELGTDGHTVLWLRYKQDMEMGEIARVMKKTKIGVRVLLYRARRRLAERVETLAEKDRREFPLLRRPVLMERTEHV
jgi:RNA polymerase sigma-70 factor (ECF subfamily)